MPDKIVCSPADVDPAELPIQKQTGVETYVLGAFNPGMARLPNGNLVIMVRVAEALKEPIHGQHVTSIRWTPSQGYVVDKYPLGEVDTTDPRKFRLLEYPHIKVCRLTSLSWLLPVELTPDGLEIVTIHYDKIIEPRTTYQEYGVEDARITRIGDEYYMTTCSVSSERHSTTLYKSTDGLNYDLLGIIIDHQNKDVLLFPEKIGDLYYAMTRPLGDLYFPPAPEEDSLAGPSINMAESPDLLHWKPIDVPFVRPSKGSRMTMKLGGGAPPILRGEGWLILYHGVEQKGVVGIYRTFWALTEKEKPWSIIHIDEDRPVLEHKPDLTRDMADSIYVTDVVFTTGIEEHGDVYVVASGELDLCCRITHLTKDRFATCK
ncbi:MAG: glycosidase [Planctomycetes bacterium]|nr:glycosidase [Planctomycetota bacterium]